MPVSLDISSLCLHFPFPGNAPGNVRRRKAPEETIKASKHQSEEACSCALTKLCRIFHACLGFFLLQIYGCFSGPARWISQRRRRWRRILSRTIKQHLKWTLNYITLLHSSFRDSSDLNTTPAAFGSGEFNTSWFLCVTSPFHFVATQGWGWAWRAILFSHSFRGKLRSFLTNSAGSVVSRLVCQENKFQFLNSSHWWPVRALKPFPEA